MIEKVLVRNRKTGKEKTVPPQTAEMMKNEAFLMEEWEVPKPGATTPHDVIKFIERKERKEDLQPVVVEEDIDDQLKQLEVLKEKLLEKKAKETAVSETEDLSIVSVKKLTDRMEYLTLDQLEGLKTDERVSVVRMVDKELKKREDEKGNISNQQDN